MINFFSKFFKKRQFSEKSSEESSEESLNIVINTDKNLSEEQRNTIITIVRDDAMSGMELNYIGFNVMMSIHELVIINRINNGIEVII